MAWSYNRLWKLLIDKSMKKKDLMEAAHLTPNTLSQLTKNKPVAMDTLEKICTLFNCRIEDIVEFIPNE